MKTRIASRRFIWLAVVLGMMSAGPWSTPTASGQVLYVDEFDGTHGNAAFHPGGVVDVTSFRVPFGGTTGDDFVGRTNFRFTLPQDGVSTAASGSADGKVAVLNLDTYNPGAPGVSFLGSDVITKRNFAVGGGLRMTTRMRVQSGVAGGMVAAPFLYDVQRESPPGTLVRDEIDHEIITNFAQSAAPDNTLTNVWNDGDFASAGAPVIISNPAGFDVTQFHDYRTDWSPSGVNYYIDGTLVRTETSVVPDDPMRAHVNFWAPESTFAAAYNAALTPSATGPGTTYRVEVDRMEIERINTAVSANLLADPSFEELPVPGGNGGWNLFNNAYLETVFVQDGLFALKTFGPFSGASNASGAFQNVAASPGEQFEGSIFAYSPSTDSIVGRRNFTNVTLQFVNAAGQVIGSVNFSPGTNQKDTPIMDGRDPNLVQDQWIQYAVNAVAPTGTAFVRTNAFFIQEYRVAGDYNRNGVVDSADYVLWRKTLNSPMPNGNGADGDGDGTVDIDDHGYWRARFGNVTPNVGDGGAIWFDNASLVRLTPAAGAAASVPEPSTCILVLYGVLAAIIGRRGSHSRS